MGAPGSGGAAHLSTRSFRQVNDLLLLVWFCGIFLQKRDDHHGDLLRPELLVRFATQMRYPKIALAQTKHPCNRARHDAITRHEMRERLPDSEFGKA